MPSRQWGGIGAFLLAVEFGIQATVRNQVGSACTAFHDPAFVEDQNQVGIAHRGDPVRDKDGGAPLHDAAASCPE